MQEKQPDNLKLPTFLSDVIGYHFLEAAHYLREVLDQRPEIFVVVVKQLKIGLRKAYALAAIDRAFHNLKVSRERLRTIGWTKLAMLASYVNADNVTALLALAETSTAHELQLFLRGEDVDPDGRTVVLHFTKEQFATFEAAILQHGASKESNGITGKEPALTVALGKLVSG